MKRSDDVTLLSRGKHNAGFSILLGLATILVILACAFSVVLILLFSPSFYASIHEKMGTADLLNLAPNQIERLVDSIIRYYSFQSNHLQTEAVFKDGMIGNFFTPDELVHMAEVNGVFLGLMILTPIFVIFTIMIVLSTFLVNKNNGLSRKTLARGTFFGSVIFAAFMVILGLWVLIDFYSVFQIMHDIIFPKGGYTFTSKLIVLLPTELFNAAGVIIVATTITITLILLVLGALGIFYKRKTIVE